jgi:phospholipase C
MGRFAPRSALMAPLSAVCAALIITLTGCGGMVAGSTPSSPSQPQPQSQSFTLTVSVSGDGGGSITSSPAGINCGTTCSSSFGPNTQVKLTATPNSTAVFSGWGGACSGTGTCTVTVAANTTVTASFTILTYSLALAFSGTGTGTVSSRPLGIDCTKTCSAVFNPGTQVVLTASAGANSTFAGWSGGCAGTGTCAVDVKQNSSVTATFVTSDSVSVTVSGTGGGTVISTPPGINCSTTCSAVFSSGTQVSLTEIASANSVFAGWSGACSGTGACQVTVGKNGISVGASFTATAYSLTVSLPGTGTGTVTSSPAGINCTSGSCSASFSPGTQVTLTAAPSANSYLVAWGAPCSGSGTCAVTLNSNVSLSSTINVWPINHIIVMAQENRSFDHYFGAMRGYWAANGIPDQSFDGLPQFNPVTGIPPLYLPPPTNQGCDPNATTGLPFNDCVIDSNSPTITSYHLLTQCLETTSPNWFSDHYDLDWANPYIDPTTNPPMNGFVATNAHLAHKANYFDSGGIRSMGYYDWTDLNYYYFMATNFATSDRFFSPVMTNTHDSRAYMMAGTSQGETAPVGSTPKDPELTVTPIFQELTDAGISWKVYVNPAYTVCTAPYTTSCLMTYDDVYLKDFTWGWANLQYGVNLGTIGPAGTCGSSTCDFENDLANNTLPQVVYIEPASPASLDEHGSDQDAYPVNIQAGAKYVAGLMNAVMASQEWSSSAFILTYDEDGGLYDHVPVQPEPSPDGIKPVDLEAGNVCSDQTGPTCDFTWTGYRIPMIVVSPYTKQNYVSHTVMDTTAVLKFIETRFGLASLTARDAAQPDMSEFFNFNTPPWMVPPTPPTQNETGPCYLNKLP